MLVQMPAQVHNKVLQEDKDNIEELQQQLVELGEPQAVKMVPQLVVKAKPMQPNK
jgi:hypothetical protein